MIHKGTLLQIRVPKKHLHEFKMVNLETVELVKFSFSDSCAHHALVVIDGRLDTVPADWLHVIPQEAANAAPSE